MNALLGCFNFLHELGVLGIQVDTHVYGIWNVMTFPLYDHQSDF